MSGGGTVYHDLGNLNYTLISDQTGPLDYDRCLEPIIRALNALGVPAQKNRTCDIAVDGKKNLRQCAEDRGRARPAPWDAAV